VSQCALQKTGEYVQELKKDVGTYPLVGEYLLVAAGISIAAARAIKWKNAYKSAAEQTAKIAGMTFTPD
jgi:intein-encoded DNA endonuclease-like protein